MTPNDALDLLDQLAATAHTNRATHGQAVIAVRVLREVITEPADEPAPAE